MLMKRLVEVNSSMLKLMLEMQEVSGTMLELMMEMNNLLKVGA